MAKCFLAYAPQQAQTFCLSLVVAWPVLPPPCPGTCSCLLLAAALYQALVGWAPLLLDPHSSTSWLQQWVWELLGAQLTCLCSSSWECRLQVQPSFPLISSPPPLSSLSLCWLLADLPLQQLVEMQDPICVACRALLASVCCWSRHCTVHMQLLVLGKIKMTAMVEHTCESAMCHNVGKVRRLPK